MAHASQKACQFHGAQYLQQSFHVLVGWACVVVNQALCCQKLQCCSIAFACWQGSANGMMGGNGGMMGGNNGMVPMANGQNPHMPGMVPIMQSPQLPPNMQGSIQSF